MAKQVFLSISLETEKAVSNNSELKTLIKTLQKDLDKKSFVDADFEPLKEKLKLAKTELQKVNDELRVTPSFTEKLAKAIKVGMGDVVVQAQKAESAIHNLKSEQSLLAAQIAKTNDAAHKNQLVEEFKKVQTQIQATQGELGKLNSTLDKGLNENKTAFQKFGTSIKDSFKQIGTGLIAAFAIDRIKDFGVECVKAFNEAELNAVKLKTAVGVNGGLTSDFENLIGQSQVLQKETIFSDDSIQQVQTMALQFGLTSKQVQALLPTITDFASATGQDLSSAIEAVIRGLEGSGKGLKLYGVEVDATKSKAELLADITQQLNDKFQGQAAIIGGTAAGNLKKLGNSFDDLKEDIGGAVSKLGEFFGDVYLFNFDRVKYFQNKAYEGLAKGQEEQGKKNEVYLTNYYKGIENLTLAQLQNLEEKKSKIQKDGNSERKREDQIELQAIRSLITEKGLLAEQQVKAPKKDNSASELKKQLAEEERLRKESFDRQQATNEKNAQELSQVQINNLKLSEAEQIKVLQDSYNKKGDFSKEAEVKLQNDILNIKIKSKENEKLLFEDDKAKQVQLNADIIALQTQQSQNEIGLKKTTEEAKTKAIEDEAKKRAEIEKQSNQIITDAYFNFTQGLFQLDLESSQQRTQIKLDGLQTQLDAQLQALDIEQQKEEGTYVAQTATEKKFEEKRKAIREQVHKEEVKLKTDAFKKEKEAAIISALINTFQSVTRSLATVPLPFGAPLAAANLAAGLVQVGLISAKPVPAFKDGVLEFEGKGTTTSDSNLVRISDGESIVPAKQTKKYKPLLENIINDEPLFGKAAVNYSSSIPAYATGFIPTSSFKNNFSSRQIQNNVNVSNTVDFELMKDFLNEKLSQPLRSYVVEQEITRSQTISRKIEQRSLLDAA